jgi:peptidoglycan L-alanyl-D-glutamate endopeptidase CwlK
MPKFGAESKRQLATCHPDLQLLFNTVIEFVDCKVLEGHRNQADQEKDFNDGNSKLHYPYGKHNATPSNAADVTPYPVLWTNLARFYWFAGIVIGVAKMLKAQGKMSHDVRYGGDWNRNYEITDEKGLRDLVHFELVLS